MKDDEMGETPTEGVPAPSGDEEEETEKPPEEGESAS